MSKKKKRRVYTDTKLSCQKKIPLKLDGGLSKKYNKGWLRASELKRTVLGILNY